MIGYLLANVVSGEALANIYCRSHAQKESPKKLDVGMRFRDREAEIDHFTDCIIDLEKASLADVLVKYMDKDVQEDESDQIEETYE